MTTKMKRKSKAALGILLTLSSCGVAYAYCPPQYQEAWVDPTFKAAIATIEGALSAVDVSLSALLETNSQRLLNRSFEHSQPELVADYSKSVVDT